MRFLDDQVALLVFARQRVGRVGQVEADVIVAVVLEAVDIDVGVAFDAGQLSGFQTGDVDFAAEQLGEAGSRVRHDPVDHAVHVRCTFPVALVAGQDRVVVARPALKDKGAGTHLGGFVVGIGHDIAEIGGKKVAGQPSQPQIAEPVTLDLFEGNLQGERVEHLDAFDLLDGAFAWGLDQVAGDGIVGEFEVGGIHWVAVAPGHAVAQKKGPDQAVLGDFPAFGHAALRHKLAREGIPADQTRHQHAVDGAAGRIGGEDRVEDGGVGTAGA